MANHIGRNRRRVVPKKQPDHKCEKRERCHENAGKNVINPKVMGKKQGFPLERKQNQRDQKGNGNQGPKEESTKTSDSPITASPLGEELEDNPGPSQPNERLSQLPRIPHRGPRIRMMHRQNEQRRPQGEYATAG